MISLAREHATKFGATHALFKCWYQCYSFLDCGFIVLRCTELEQLLGVVYVAPQLLVGRYGLLQRGSLLGNGLRLLAVVPKAGRERLLP
jgi:hypothetical protein